MRTETHTNQKEQNIVSSNYSYPIPPDELITEIDDEHDANVIYQHRNESILHPIEEATLARGETVLDLGCGGGEDVITAAKRIGATGKAYGLDHNGPFLVEAAYEAKQSEVSNIEWLEADITKIPLPDNSIDVIISYAALTLVADKKSAFSESARVLKPGGRFVVMDCVTSPNMREYLRGMHASGAVRKSKYYLDRTLTIAKYTAFLTESEPYQIEVYNTKYKYTNKTK